MADEGVGHYGESSFFLSIAEVYHNFKGKAKNNKGRQLGSPLGMNIED